MKIFKTSNYKEMSRKAANILSAQIILKPDSVLGLATGSTSVGHFLRTVHTCYPFLFSAPAFALV